MSCAHRIWNCYCKLHEELCDKPCSPSCKDYINEDTSMKISDTENAYVSLLEVFLNKLYPSENFSLFGYDASKYAETIMMDLGFTEAEVNDAYNQACLLFDDTKYSNDSIQLRLHSFCSRMIFLKNHKEKEYSTSYKLVLTLILGFLGKLNSANIMISNDPETYFKAMVEDTLVSEMTIAVEKTRSYVRASMDNNLAEGMRRFEAWMEQLASKDIPPKELTIADIEKQLGYKVKIVGEEK